ncbi:SDR family NAD(P)-dependent oxidoreductase [Nitrosospira sp. NpAV]|uniref:SDR family NAD(P)-dependent oxidoreductase n=1 Tax=Nitrosospira sp. NpAV TaxID=58133 RepID=UPI0005A0011C|nr:SDR family NAD(P)-dependent oxidoreductase [Nitrosospira sp. NpAV]KIO48085.1 hypothetical protein SQ11_12850 [Nitrosospira sp. NpAV]
MTVENNIVAITEASHGIGLATAKRFAKQGACLALNYEKTDDSLEEVAALAAEHGGKAISVSEWIAITASIRCGASTKLSKNTLRLASSNC